MRITKEAVIQAASDIADERGLNDLSLKAIAEKLNIRTPSLYNHITSLNDLLRAVAHNGMRQMNEQMKQTAIGKTGAIAIKAAAVEYLNYMIIHPGVYETIQWAAWHGTEETADIFDDYLSLLTTLIGSCGFPTEHTDEILAMLTGLIHGFTTLQLRYALAEPDKVRNDLRNALDTLLNGVQLKYGIPAN